MAIKFEYATDSCRVYAMLDPSVLAPFQIQLPLRAFPSTHYFIFQAHMSCSVTRNL